MNTNLHIVRNGVSQDSRVLKITSTLLGSGLFSSVEIAGFEHAGLPEHEDLAGRRIWRVALKSRRLPKDLLSQSIKYLEWHQRVVARYRHAPLSVIHCHDLEPLPIAVELKQMTGARLIYDAHELQTERSGIRGLRKRFMAITEARGMRHVDSLITVSPSILNWYRQRYPEISARLVRNVPKVPPVTTEPEDLRARFGVPEGALLFIFQGGCLPGRGIERMLAAFADPAVIHHLVFMGSGPLVERIREFAHHHRNIHSIAPVAPDAVLAMTGGADVGVNLTEDTCLNHRYCLPNKLFEYWTAGIPVLASDLPDQASLVNEYRAGWLASSGPRGLVESLVALGPEDVASVRPGVERIRREVTWNREAVELVAAYQEALERRSS